MNGSHCLDFDKTINYSFPLENCADELGGYEQGRSKADGQTPQMRALQARFSTPVTLTGVQLQGDSAGNAITSYTLRYKLSGEDAEKEVVDSSGVVQVRVHNKIVLYVDSNISDGFLLLV